MTKFLLKSNSILIVQFYIWFISFRYDLLLSLASTQILLEMKKKVTLFRVFSTTCKNISWMLQTPKRKGLFFFFFDRFLNRFYLQFSLFFFTIFFLIGSSIGSTYNFHNSFSQLWKRIMKIVGRTYWGKHTMMLWKAR